ncbi:hypothetical protein E1A91_D05G235900v1 [Gossypium mustelinum]|uniref:J domain-containing protein n=2 Tax=Gossypium TaxID=3633 RepID=A0A5D2V020_GOSMU|nr:hypothetical protein B456_009G229800 [Gossypium raimondii]TYI82662.1 hypothetical protein E1A91_D05G235900v1 [Gossypium mustelinum]TYI82664.1 hypothetical protein E1A91_D05G235900v1 [Gossypium mustelinum]
MEENGNRAEAVRLLGIAEKLLQNRDFNGSRDFAILAQETEPLLDGSDQILAVADVILAGEKRINNHQDWYSILQIDGRSEDNDLIKKQYRRLALLLHPDKNKSPFADHAFQLVADAWAVLSNSSKKSLYDKELSLFTRIDLSSGGGDRSNQAGKLPVTRKGQSRTPNPKTPNENQRCQNCEKAFHAVDIPTLPPLVPGKEAYYCCWAFFPLGFVSRSPESEGKASTGFPNWMQPTFPAVPPHESERNGGIEQATPPAPMPAPVSAAAPAPTPPSFIPSTTATKVVENMNNVAVVSGRNVSNSGSRKRGRPRKNPL